MGNLREKKEAGEPLMQQAIEALRRYHKAKAAESPPDEIARLKMLAESLFQAASEYQLRALGGPVRPLQ